MVFPRASDRLGVRVADLVFHRFLSRAVSEPLRDLGRFRLCETGLEQRFAAAPERASETDYAQKAETQTIRSEHAAPAAGTGKIH